MTVLSSNLLLRGCFLFLEAQEMPRKDDPNSSASDEEIHCRFAEH